MQEQIVGFDVAKLAKDKGFNLEVKAYFDFKKFGVKPLEFFNKIDANYFSHWDFDLNKKINAGYISAPTQSLLQKWLREKHKLHTVIIYTINGFTYKIVDLKLNHENVCDIVFESYEDALENALYNMLTLI